MDAIDVLRAQLTRYLFAIAKFLLTVSPKLLIINQSMLDETTAC